MKVSKKPLIGKWWEYSLYTELSLPQMTWMRGVKEQIIEENLTFYSVGFYFSLCEYMTLTYFVIENYGTFEI